MRGDVVTDLVPTDQIEQIVGVTRHPTKHYVRAVSSEHMMYILHSRECLDSGIDLRYCAYSHALDVGLDADLWNRHEDQPVEIRIEHTRLVPVPVASEDQPTLDFGSRS